MRHAARQIENAARQTGNAGIQKRQTTQQLDKAESHSAIYGGRAPQTARPPHPKTRKVASDFSRRGPARRETTEPLSSGILRSVPVFSLRRFGRLKSRTTFASDLLLLPEWRQHSTVILIVFLCGDEKLSEPLFVFSQDAFDDFVCIALGNPLTVVVLAAIPVEGFFRNVFEVAD